MTTVRISTTEVQVDQIVYLFNSADHADDFEACVATVDLAHCEREHAPVGKHPALQTTNIRFTEEATPAEDGGVYFKAEVNGKPVLCRIDSEALTQHFSAPETIRPVDAYARGRETIHAIAAQKLRTHPDEHVLIRTQDIGQAG